jgi:hypothetical protein
LFATRRFTPHPKAIKSASIVIAAKGAGHSIGDPRPAVTQYVAQHTISEGTYPSLAVLVTAFVLLLIYLCTLRPR